VVNFDFLGDLRCDASSSVEEVELLLKSSRFYRNLYHHHEVLDQQGMRRKENYDAYILMKKSDLENLLPSLRH